MQTEIYDAPIGVMDFMFQLTEPEFKNLIFQYGISSSGWGGTRKLPQAFKGAGKPKSRPAIGFKLSSAIKKRS